MTLFGPDASRWQGDVHWGPVDASMAFGWEKVSEGPGKGITGGYVNERWGPEKPQMAARGKASGFIPGGYLFLAEGPGAPQAEYFARAAGDMAGFAIAVDVEPRDATGSRPTLAQAKACVNRLRAIYPRHPIGGYLPRWYWGTQSTTFVDYLWASNYVTGSGVPTALYRKVVPSQWAGYGGAKPALLQFTDKAVVAGVDGPCDCSAYRGTEAELRTLLLGGGGPAPAAKQAPARKETPVAKLRRVWIPSPNHSGRGGAKVDLIVFHTSEGAQTYQSLGSFFANPASQVSSQVGIDDTPGVIGEYVRRERAAWTAAGANTVAVQAEFCTPSGAADGWSRATWMNHHRHMLANAAAWAAEEAAHHGIPLTALTPAQAQRGGRGVCQHSDLGTWGGGHHDCGHGFPMDYVISLAKGAAPAGEVDLMQPGYLEKGANAKTPIVIPAGAKRLRFFAHRPAQVHIDLIGAPQPKVDDLTLGYDRGAQQVSLGAALAAVVTRVDGDSNEVSFVASA